MTAILVVDTLSFSFVLAAVNTNGAAVLHTMHWGELRMTRERGDWVTTLGVSWLVSSLSDQRGNVSSLPFFCPKLINSKGMELHCLVVVRVVWVYLAVLLCNKRKEKRFGAFDHTPFTADYQLKNCTLMWPPAKAAPSSCKAVCT